MSEGPRVGGQAVIEGVMMRSRQRAAVAVRDPEGRIVARVLNKSLIEQSSPIWRKPFFRGAANLLDTLRLGMAGLNWSAEVAEGEQGSSRGSSFLGTALAVVLAVVFFAWLPLKAGIWILPESSQFAVHLLAGLFRITAFFLYILAISLIPDIRRVFQYHGAEHQTIHAFERDGESLVEAAAAESPLHQRCGTSFLLLVMLGAVVFYAVVDSLVVALSETRLDAHWRLLYHVPLIPLVLGVSYELLKLADRHLESSAIARLATYPGMLLQRLTTRRADRSQVEVAVASLRLALREDPGPEVTVLGEEEEPE